MITSPKQYDPDDREAKLERAIDRLKGTQNSSAMVVCWAIKNSDPGLPVVSKYARIALAANNGITKLLLKRFEGM